MQITFQSYHKLNQPVKAQLLEGVTKYFGRDELSNFRLPLSRRSVNI